MCGGVGAGGDRETAHTKAPGGQDLVCLIYQSAPSPSSSMTKEQAINEDGAEGYVSPNVHSGDHQEGDLGSF